MPWINNLKLMPKLLLTFGVLLLVMLLQGIVAYRGLHSLNNVTTELAETPTRLDDTPAKVRHGLVNWGYALSDVWLRGRLDPSAPKGDLPYPDAPLTR